MHHIWPIQEKALIDHNLTLKNVFYCEGFYESLCCLSSYKKGEKEGYFNFAESCINFIQFEKKKMASLRKVYTLLFVAHGIQILVTATAGIVAAIFLLYEGQLSTLYLLGATLSFLLILSMYFLTPEASMDPGTGSTTSTPTRARLRVLWTASAFSQAIWLIILLMRADVTTHKDIHQVSTYTFIVCLFATFASWMSTLYAIWLVRLQNPDEKGAKVQKIAT